ncbi:MAG: aminopeptidase [Verrucomicrobiaceae bacterium]|nr:aminopeptidase [Verrucomicrobiaceae bacterium]
MLRPKLTCRWWFVALAAAALASCRTVSFYTQAARGQWEISSKARPIEGLLKDEATPANLKKQLQLVQELRAFASNELHLPAEQQYDCYCDLGRKYAVWVIYAAPEFSVKGKTWWYPLVGSLKYRGFFDEKRAEAEAAELRAQGYDVFVGGVEAYSTLGWFRDPVLNTFLRHTDVDLAEMLFHELTHQRLYIPGDTDFNEAFANAVAHEGVCRWLRSQGRAADLARFRTDVKLEREFVSLVLATRGRLETIYARTDKPPAELRALKAAEFLRLRQESEELKQRWGGTVPVDRWFTRPVNNARLNTLATYFDLVPAFERMLKAGHYDLERMFRRVEALKNQDAASRRRALTAPEEAPIKR